MQKTARNGTPAFIVPARLLADTLEPLIAKLNHELGAQEDQNNLNANADQAGAVTAIAARASVILGNVKPEAVPRRLWAIRYGEGWRTSTEIADALLLALDVNIEDTTLPTFPGTMAGSMEMVDTWAPELNELEARIVAGKMRRFCEGFLLGCSVDAENIVELGAARTVCNFIRQTTKAAQLELAA